MIKTKKDADFFFQGYACAVSTLLRGRVGKPALAEDVTDSSVKVGFCPGGARHGTVSPWRLTANPHAEILEERHISLMRCMLPVTRSIIWSCHFVMELQAPLLWTTENPFRSISTVSSLFPSMSLAVRIRLSSLM